MKKLLFILTLSFISMSLPAQQVLPVSFIQYQKSVDTSHIEEKAAETRNDTNVIIYGISSAEALQFDKLAATGSFAAEILLTKRFIAGLSFNFGTQIKSEKADSVPLSLFYFPDVANTSLCANIEYNLPKRSSANFNRYSLTAQGSVQRRIITKDSLSFDFSIINVNAGPQYKWLYTRDQHQFILTAGVYFNYVEINRNNTDAFNSLFNDYHRAPDAQIKRNFSGFSSMISFQMDKVILFGRMYNDMSQRHDLAFTVGIKATASFMSF